MLRTPAPAALPEIRPLAAVHLREALEAAQAGETPAAVAALMHIDSQSWHGIRSRLAELGADVGGLLAAATKGSQR